MHRLHVIVTFFILSICLRPLAAAEDGRPPLQWNPVTMPGLGSPVNDLVVSPHDSNRLLVGGRQFGIYWSDNRGDSWHAATGLSCYHVNAFLWHPKNPNMVYAATMNGVYLSADAGESWELRSEGMPTDGFSESYTYLVPVNCLIMDPVNPMRLLAFCGVSDNGVAARARLGGLWETTNGGHRWHKVCTITREGATNAPEAKGINITGASFGGDIPVLVYATSDEGGFLESTDGGKTWEQKNKGLPHTGVNGLWVEPGNPNTVLINLTSYTDSLQEGGIQPGGIYKTVSGGLSWFPVSTSIPKVTKGNLQDVSSFPVFAVSSKAPFTIYTCDASVKSNSVYKTTDSGRTWPALATQRNPDTEPAEAPKAVPQITTFLPVGLTEPTVMRVDPVTADTVYMAGSTFVIRSQDGGKTWTDLCAQPKENDSWTSRGLAGLDVMDIIWDPANGNRLFVAAGNSAKFMESVDNGVSWTLRGTDPYDWGGGSSGCIAGKHVYLGSGQYGLFGSIIHFDGDTWQTLSGKAHGLPTFKRCGQVTGIYAPPGETGAVSAVIGGRLYGSQDHGTSWSALSNRRNLGWIAPIPGTSNYYLSGRPNSYLVTGKDLTSIGGPKSAGRVVCDTGGQLYLAANKSLRGGLWRYASGKWTRLLDENLITDVAVDPTNPKRLAVCTTDSGTTANATTSGIWLSDDGGKRWAVATTGLTVVKSNTITFDPKDSARLLLGTAGTGIYDMYWPTGHDIGAARHYLTTANDTSFSSKTATTGLPTGDLAGKTSPLRNGDMEQGNTIPTGWTNRWVGKGRIIVARDPSTSHDGEAALRIQTVGGAGKGQISQIINAQGIKQVTLTAFVKSEGKVFSQVSIQSFDARWKTLQYKTVKHFRNQKDWIKITGTAKLPPGTIRFGVGLLIEGQGKAWMDSVTLDVE